MYEYIDNNELRELLQGAYSPIWSQRFRKLMIEIDDYVIYKLISEDGTMILYLDESYRSNKELALESVTYRNFFVRDIDNDDPDVPNFDASMINEVDNAYESLSEKLKSDIEIIKRAYKSYDEIMQYLKDNPDPSIIYSDGVQIFTDSDYMLDVINDQYMSKYEDMINDYEIENDK